MEEYNAYVGMDDHKDTIAVAVACPGRERAEGRGVIPNTPGAVTAMSVTAELGDISRFDSPRQLIAARALTR
jgi:hypothetical protein